MLERTGGNISVYIDNNLLEKLKKLSVQEDRSVSKMICKFVRDGLDLSDWNKKREAEL